MLKLPKQLLICGKTCDITYSTEAGGGSTDLSTGAITIGAGIPSEILEVLLHEASELILYSLGHRFTRYEEGNDGIRFVLSHHDYENFIRELTFVIDQITGSKRITRGKKS